MSGDADQDAERPLAPAVEARLAALLEPLRLDPPRADPSVAAPVVRRARWQGSVRRALELAGHFARAVGDTAELLRGRRRTGSEEA